MNKNRKLKNYSKRALSLSLAAMSMMSPNMMSLTANAAENPSANASGSETLVEMHVQNDYTVQVPAGIILTYNENGQARPLYDADYDILFKGHGNGKTLAVETDDVNMEGEAGRHFVTNYLGDKEDASHIAIGTKDFSEEGEIIKGYASMGADNVKMGNYDGTAEFRYFMVDTGTKVSDLKNFFNLDETKVAMGAKATHQLTATDKDGNNINDQVEFTSSDESVATVTDNGLIMTSANAAPGSEVTITASLSKDDKTDTAALLDELSRLGAMEVHAAEDGTFIASVTVTIVDIDFMDDENGVDSVEIFPGENKSVRALLKPETSDTVTWSATKAAGVALQKNGNDCTINIANDMAEGTTFKVIATYGDYSKELTVTAKSRHTHVAGEPVREAVKPATCEEDGSYEEVVYCTDDGKELSRTTVTIPATGHSWGEYKDVNGEQVRECSDCHEVEKNGLTNYKITYNLDGGEISGQKTTYTKDDSFTLPVPTKDGYTFVGWTGPNGSTAEKNVTVAKGSTGDKTFTAKWKKNNPVEGTLKKTGTYRGLTYKLYDTTGNGVSDTCLLTGTQTGKFLSTNEDAPYKNFGIVNVVVDDATLISTQYMFYRCNNLGSIKFTNTANTNNVTDMGFMFNGCQNLTSLDVSNFDTSSVTDMVEMFFNCKSLTSLDVSNFDTSSVTDMNSMFDYCESLTSLDVSNFDTSNVIDMREMFEGCKSLTSLDVSNFDTSNVTYMSYMFDNCNKLVGLDVSNFDTSNVTSFYGMFYNCSSLTNLNVSNFNTSNARDISRMFYNCQKLTSLDVSNFNTSNVRDMGEMFYNCNKLTSLDVSNFNTSNVENMRYMFYGCSKLTSLNVSNFDTSNVTDMYGMFSNCPAPKPSWYKE